MSHPLRLRLKWLQTDSGNDFPENGGVWLLLQIRSNWKAFPVDWIWEPKQRKWFSVSIFTSKYFRPWKIEEREREREKERIDRDITVRRHHWLAQKRQSRSPLRSSRDASIFAWSQSTHRTADITGLRSSADRNRDLLFDLRAITIVINASRERVDRDRERVDRDHDRTKCWPLRSWSRSHQSQSLQSWSRSHRSRSLWSWSCLRLSRFYDFFSGFCLCFEG